MLKHEQFIQDHPEVAEWLRGRPAATKRKFANSLLRFCEAMNVEPEEWRGLDKFEARDIAWQYVKPKIESHATVAKTDLVTLKSWYRNNNGDQLPLDSGKGGKHHFRVKHQKRAHEHIPDKREIYQIVDMVSNLRDKALLLLLYQSGVRVNVVEHLRYGDVANELDKSIITLKVTGDLDHKLRGRDIPFYYTFLNGEGSETLKRYCEVQHKNSSLEAPLFPTKSGKPIDQRYVWLIVKNCLRKAGFNPKNTWTHTIRKAFRRQVAQADVDFEFKEMIMGHVIGGSREAYFDRHNITWFIEQYQKIKFGREAVGSETFKLQKRIEELKLKLNGQAEKIRQIENAENTIEFIKKEIDKRMKELHDPTEPTDLDLEEYRAFKRWQKERQSQSES
jgi:site-specific recombinase XerD